MASSLGQSPSIITFHVHSFYMEIRSHILLTIITNKYIMHMYITHMWRPKVSFQCLCFDWSEVMFVSCTHITSDQYVKCTSQYIWLETRCATHKINLTNKGFNKPLTFCFKFYNLKKKSYYFKCLCSYHLIWFFKLSFGSTSWNAKCWNRSIVAPCMPC